MFKSVVITLNIVFAIGIVTAATTVQQPPPVKLDWIPLRPANKSDPHPLNATGNDAPKDGRFFGGGGNPLQFFAKISGAISQFQGIASLLKAGSDLRKLFGLDPKDNAILVDNRCSTCWVFVKCGTNVKNTEDFEITPDDGLILRFRTNPPFDLFDNYVCESHDLGTSGNGKVGGVTGDRRATIDVYGRSAPKRKMTLIEIRNHQILAIDGEGFIDANQRPVNW